MNWKKLLSSVLLYAAGLFVFLMFGHPKDVLSPGHGVFVANVIQCFAVSLCIVGGQEFDRLGHRRVSGILIFCVIPISIALFSVLIIRGEYSVNWLYAVSALFAVPFPVALYLNRRQPKSISQPTTPNVP